ncbi:MAG: hypothetical protein GX471_08640, partial [Candidatus Microthrix parvicella]|nr:hypothetical protein [Candidatus Microthrix parvicella]
MTTTSFERTGQDSTLLVVGGAGATGHWVVRHLGSRLKLADGFVPARILVADTDPDVVDRLPPASSGGPVLEAVHLVISADGHEATEAGVSLAHLAARAAEVWVAVGPDDLMPV